MPEPHLRANRSLLSGHARAAVDRGGTGRLYLPVRPEPALGGSGAEPEPSRYLAGAGDKRYRSGRVVFEDQRRPAPGRSGTAPGRFRWLLDLGPGGGDSFGGGGRRVTLGK